LKKTLIAILIDEKSSNFANEFNIDNKNDVVLISTKKIDTLIKQKNFFIEIKNPKFKRYNYLDIITIYINSLIEIGMLEFIYNFKIYKSIEDYRQDYSLNFSIEEIYYINPIFVLNKNKELINKVNEYFKVGIKKQYFIDKYIKTRLIYKDNHFIILESIFFRRNIKKYSLEYFHIADFIKFRDIILFSLLWKIPNNFKKNIRIFLFKKLARKNDDDVYKRIFTQAYRNKILFYKYIKIFNSKKDNN
jgi:hypothetical protein